MPRRAVRWRDVSIVLGVAVSWVGSTEFAKAALKSGDDGGGGGGGGSFSAPFFTMWFTTAFMVLMSPSLALLETLAGRRRRWGEGGGGEECKDVCSVNGNFSERSWSITATTATPPPGVVSWLRALRYAPLFYFLWGGANYAYVRALADGSSASAVTVVFSSTPAFVYILSVAILGECWDWVRLSGVACSIGGVVLASATAGGDGGFTRNGTVETIAAAVCAAFYKVMFKRVVGDAGVRDVARILTLLGLLNLLAAWWVALVLKANGTEPLEWKSVPWGLLVIHSALSLLFNFFVNFGIAKTWPLFISLGTILGIPLSFLVDGVSPQHRHQKVSPAQIVGSALIVAGFVVQVVRGVPRRRRCAEAAETVVEKEDEEDGARLLRK